jgi:hypothetical protein
MSFVKESQSVSFEGIDIPLRQPVSSPVVDENELRMPEDHLHLPAELVEDLVIEEPEEEDDISLEIEEPEAELVLTLDKIPGGLDQDEIVEEPEELEVEEPEEVKVSDDPWDWGGSAKNFLPWLSKMMQGIPVHSGRDTAGLERAIAYLEAVDREISRAVRIDLNNEIAIDSVEKARDEIQRGLERLEERLEKVKSSKYPKKGKKGKKKADAEQEGLIKEAQKATHVGGIVITVPLFTSYLARVCINGMVSAGHDIEDMFTKLAKRYKLSEREQAELVQLLSDMNYPLRRDRGIPLDEEIDTSSSDNFDWAQNFRA